MSDEKSPISFEVDVTRIPAKGMRVTVTPDADERTSLATMHGLEEVLTFKADLLVTQWRKDGAHIEGRINATIIQTCVVTLEPLTSKLDVDVDIVMVPEGSKLARPKFDESGELVLSAEGADPPDTFSGVMIDVGAQAEEHFALAIDPYPRKTGASLPAADNDEGDEKLSPFSKLADWQPKQ